MSKLNSIILIKYISFANFVSLLLLPTLLLSFWGPFLRAVASQPPNNLLSLSKYQSVYHHFSNTKSLSCSRKIDSSFWIRNSCLNGFITVHQRRVLAQHQGLDKYHPKVEFIKETCQDAKDYGPRGRVLVRLYHKLSNTYVCFTKRGRLKAVSPRRANRLGKLCAFIEYSFHDMATSNKKYPNGYPFSSIPYNQVQYRSAYRKRWLLGFIGRRKRITSTTKGHAVSLPKPIFDRKNKFKKVRPSKCDYRFSTGIYTKQRKSHPWPGISILLKKEEEKNKRMNYPSLNDLFSSSSNTILN